MNCFGKMRLSVQKRLNVDKPMKEKIVKFPLHLLLVIQLTACAPFISKNKSQVEEPGTYGAQVGIVNHTDRYIYSTYVGDGLGGHADAYSNGVANMCCITVPDEWHPGLSLKVSWDMPIKGVHTYKEKVVQVEKYDEPGSVYLHFFPDDQVRIVVTRWVGGSSKHPIPRAVNPASLNQDK